jgi:hypothetical protein
LNYFFFLAAFFFVPFFLAAFFFAILNHLLVGFIERRWLTRVSPGKKPVGALGARAALSRAPECERGLVSRKKQRPCHVHARDPAIACK